MEKKLYLKKIYREDFESVFSVHYLEKLDIYATELMSHDITLDKEFTTNRTLNKKLTEKYADLINTSYVAPVFIRWVNRFVEYGVFAEQDIKKNSMICEYTGVVRIDEKSDVDNLYVWDYPTFLYKLIPGKKRRRKIIFCIDAQVSGNYARFINHSDDQYQNVCVQVVAAQNIWHVVYIAKKDIYKGQQLLTSYGDEYWKDRNIVPHSIKP